MDKRIELKSSPCTQPIPSGIIKAFNKTRPRSRRHFLCNAVYNTVFLSIDGNATPCCINQKYIFGNYTTTPLDEIWKSNAIEEFRSQIERNCLPSGCENCREALLSGNFASAQIHQYDKVKQKKKQIQRIEFQTGNTCNLACDMCSGKLSSSVAANKEHYQHVVNHSFSLTDPAFYNVLTQISEAHFSGGEPFLNSFYLDIWKFLTENNPKCSIIIQTNGSVLNTKLQAILEKGNFHVNISVDSLIPEVFKEIRINTNLDIVLKNLEYFSQYMAKRNRTISLAVCVMPNNYREIPDIVDFCNRKGMEIIFNTVSFPARDALWLLSSQQLDEIYTYFISKTLPTKTKNEKTNNINFNGQIEYLKNIRQKVLDFEQSETIAGDKELISELFENILQKLHTATDERKKTEDKEYQALIHRFATITSEEPDTRNKSISLMIMNKYDDQLLLSSLFRENEESTRKIISKLSILASIK